MAREYLVDIDDIASISRGDIFVERADRYRNDCVLMWDGCRLVCLDTSYDDYGSVPREFRVGKEFPPKYWDDVIDHNQLVFLDDDLYEQFEYNSECGDIAGAVEIRGRMYSIMNANLTDMTKEMVDKFKQDKPPVTFDGSFICVYI